MTRGYLTPQEVPESTVCRTLFIPASAEWLAIVSGAISELCKTYNWDLAGAVTVEEAAARCVQLLDEYYASSGVCVVDVRQSESEPCTLEKSDGTTWTPFADLQLCPPLVRLGAGGKVQTSADGGTTWTDAEVQTPEPPPPTGGYNNHCLAARNAAEVYRLAWSEIYNAWAGEGQIAFGVIAFTSTLAAMIIFPPAVTVVWATFLALWELISTATGGEWTDEITHTLTCIFLCRSTENADGSITFNWAQVQTDIAAQDPQNNLIWLVIQYLAEIVGPEATGRAASTRSIAAYDCTDCGCPGDCVTADFAITRGDFAQFDWTDANTCRTGDVFAGGEWVDGSGWTTTAAGGGVAKCGIHVFCDGAPTNSLYYNFSSTINSILVVEIRRVSDDAELGCAYLANTNASQGWNTVTIPAATSDDIEIKFGVITPGNPAGVYITAIQWEAP